MFITVAIPEKTDVEIPYPKNRFYKKVALAA
jgi:hypothetical protein